MKDKQPTKRRPKAAAPTPEKKPAAVINYSGWHAARAHGFAIARVCKQLGIREVARRCKFNPMMISRFAKEPTHVSLIDVYQIAEAIGYQFDLKPIPPEKWKHNDKLEPTLFAV